MPSSRLAAAFVLAGVLAAACGSSDATNRDYGEPPDPSKFNPGSGSGDDPYGYGGQQTGASIVVCPEELKRCPHTITYPFNGETSVELRGDFGGPETWEVGKPMTRTGNLWSVDIQVPLATPIQYKFIVDGVWKTDPNQPIVTDAQSNSNNTFEGKTCEEPACEEEGELPPGVYDWRDAVIYFVFVDRFLNGDSANSCTIPGVDPIANYLGGDWKGVTERIKDGYFKSIGANTLWVTVPFDNPNKSGKGVGGDTRNYSGYHGYWPLLGASATQLSTEGCFGTFQDLKTLVSTAHQNGIKVLFDYAMVHVHSDSPVYQQHNDWFWPNSNGSGGDCVCGQGCSWDAQAERCWFTDYLPHWNYTNAAARDWAVENAVEWVKQTGVDGFRADAIKHVDISWLTSLRAKLKTDVIAQQDPQQRFYMVGETYDFGNRELLKKYIDPTTKLDGQFDFPLRKLIVEATLMRTTPMSELSRFMDTNDLYYGSRAIMSTFIGNHDLPRIIHLAANNRPWGNDQGADGKNLAWSNQPGPVSELAAYERVANGFAVIFTNRGAPLIYYGDEIGLPGAGDPDNRRVMQWSGYTQAQTYLRDRLKRLGEIRARHPALRRGRRSTINADSDAWVFKQELPGQDVVYVAINRSDSSKVVNGLPNGALNEEIESSNANGPTVTVPPRQVRIFSPK
ncbi:MAG: hypothetical protein KIT84_02640 [Labilithrix sp.]|nr:hypothetical protein [Labilithrix sp.]MCW5809878.1 hypothetical protein [Labilithrix sp.]